jgi:hypothetical protein
MAHYSTKYAWELMQQGFHRRAAEASRSAEALTAADVPVAVALCARGENVARAARHKLPLDQHPGLLKAVQTAYNDSITQFKRKNFRRNAGMCIILLPVTTALEMYNGTNHLSMLQQDLRDTLSWPQVLVGGPMLIDGLFSSRHAKEGVLHLERAYEDLA